MTHGITGSASIQLGAATIAPAGPPHTYLGMARHFVNGLQPLVAAGPPCALPFAFLAAQTVECALKAFLSSNGDDRRLKQAPLRHNLEMLWSLSAAEGLTLEMPAPVWLVRLSALHDTPYYLRYSTGVHAMVSPAAAPMCNAVEGLVELVARTVSAP
jgi:hypothetical protein